jgi:hypothetical protein
LVTEDSFLIIVSFSLIISERIDVTASFTEATVSLVTEIDRERSSATVLILREDSLILCISALIPEAKVLNPAERAEASLEA